MSETVTITSKDSNLKVANLSSLFAYPMDTITIRSDILTVMFEINEIDDEMRDLEHAAMVDFLRFEEMD